VAAPRGRSGVTSAGLVELVDMFPTLTDLCGIPTAPGMEGTSFSPLLSEPSRSWKKAVFTVLRREGAADIMGASIRTARYRYTQWGDEKVAELYDYETDPNEYENLVGDPQQSGTLARMQEVLKNGWKGALASVP